MQGIRKVVGAPVTIPLAQPTRFNITGEYIQHNSGLLEDCDFDLTHFLSSQGSRLDPGSWIRLLSSGPTQDDPLIGPDITSSKKSYPKE
jgi:hypothetical protein